MIVNHRDLPARQLRARAAGSTWRCLARRGMLHSECEAFEQIRLAPGAVWTHASSHGTDTAVYAVAGRGSVHDEDGSRGLGAGNALLVPARSAVRVSAGACGLDLTLVRTLPLDVIARLPARVPELPPREQSPIFRQAADTPRPRSTP